MSYLNVLRLHFAGRFQANVSTVNNDPGHFDNASFRLEYQRMQQRDAANGWFNPEGDATWRLRGCTVTGAWSAAGAVPADDPVRSCTIEDSDRAAPAKLVDLDPEQQLVSEIWGLEVRIVDAAGTTWLRGDYVPAAFMDIWDRAVASGAGGDVDASAMYQSVLTNLEWGDVASSPLLTALQSATPDGLLSIKFTTDGINFDFTSPDFMSGRIVGTIGPATRDEPRHFVTGRHFVAPAAATPRNFFAPAGGINHCVAVVDDDHGRVLLDLGNALPTAKPGTDIPDLGTLVLSVAGSPHPIGTIPNAGADGYATAGWYERTAGIVQLPLTPESLTAVEDAPLLLASADPSPGSPVQIGEVAGGAYLRADRFVYRVSPGDTTTVTVHATRWGKPLAGAAVTFVEDASQLQPSNFVDSNDVPAVGTPTSALRFPAAATTDSAGVATITVTCSDPGTPRAFDNGTAYGIDGQVYGIRARFADPAPGAVENQWNFVSILLWSGFTPSTPVRWSDVQPVLQQYANLYPVMKRFLDLGDPASVVANTHLLRFAFGLDATDPNAMPVTRDLSPAKRAAILAWLEHPVVDAAPQPPPPNATIESEGRVTVPTEAARKGGKAAASARRLVLRPNPGATRDAVR